MNKEKIDIFEDSVVIFNLLKNSMNEEVITTMSLLKLVLANENTKKTKLYCVDLSRVCLTVPSFAYWLYEWSRSRVCHLAWQAQSQGSKILLRTHKNGFLSFKIKRKKMSFRWKKIIYMY